MSIDRENSKYDLFFRVVASSYQDEIYRFEKLNKVIKKPWDTKDSFLLLVVAIDRFIPNQDKHMILNDVVESMLRHYDFNFIVNALHQVKLFAQDNHWVIYHFDFGTILHNISYNL